MDLLHICFYAKMAENCQPIQVGGESKRVKCVTVTQSSLTAPLERYMRVAGCVEYFAYFYFDNLSCLSSFFCPIIADPKSIALLSYNLPASTYIYFLGHYA